MRNGKCRHCGCTETQACPGGCWWVRPGVCSSCKNREVERPVLFSAPMVRAILSGQKSQTRRIVKLPPAPMTLGEWQPSTISADPASNSTGLSIPLQATLWHTRTGTSLMCPHGQPGDRLWVRETWAHHPDYPETTRRAIYRADPGSEHDAERWRPSIHMPRWASRLTLEITDIGVERLHGISEDDALAEGVESEAVDAFRRSGSRRPAGFAFRELWVSINGADNWASNPFVWVISFRQVKP